MEPRVYAAASGDEPFVLPGRRPPEPRLPNIFFNDYVADPADLVAAKERVRLHHRLGGQPVWIARRDIVRASELKRVKACWPIKELGIEEGDAEGGTIRLRADGAGVVTYQGALDQPVHAWSIDAVYAIRVEGPNVLKTASGEWGWGNLDPASGKVPERANWAAGESAQVLERPANAEACAGGVVVE